MNMKLGEIVLEFRASGNKREPQNHGKVWVGSALKIILFQSSCHGQGHVQLDQVAKSPGLALPAKWNHSFPVEPVLV